MLIFCLSKNKFSNGKYLIKFLLHSSEEGCILTTILQAFIRELYNMKDLHIKSIIEQRWEVSSIH